MCVRTCSKGYRVATVVLLPTNTLHELADGVFVWIQPGGESGVSNAGAVVDDDGLTVVDTLMVRSQWEPFAAAVAGLGAPVRRLVLTHAHIDHVGGTHGVPQRDGARLAADERPARRRDADRRVQGVHARVRRRVRRARRDRHPAGHPPRDRRRAADAAHRAAAGDRPHRRRRDGARRRRRRAVRRRPVLLRRDAARVPGRPRDVGRTCSTWSPTSRTRSFPATARSAASPRSATCSSTCATASGERHDPARPVGRWPERDPRDAINIEHAALLAAGHDAMPNSMLKAIGFG